MTQCNGSLAPLASMSQANADSCHAAVKVKRACGGQAAGKLRRYPIGSIGSGGVCRLIGASIWRWKPVIERARIKPD